MTEVATETAEQTKDEIVDKRELPQAPEIINDLTPEEINERLAVLEAENEISIKEQWEIIDSAKDTESKPENPTREIPKGKNKLISSFEKLIPKAFKLEIVGAENLAKITDNENVVITTTHITDMDLTIALAGIGKASRKNERFGQTKLVQMADNLKNAFFQNVVKRTGEENWLTVSVFGDADNRVNKYNPDDFKEIEDALKQGFPIAIAESLDARSDGWNLSDKVGNGAARLALAGNVIIPIAVEIDEKLPMQTAFRDQVLMLWKLIKRPKAKVIIGEPIRVEPNPNVDDIDSVLEKRASGGRPTKEELEKFKSASQDLKRTSKDIKYAIADLLPEDRRGKWTRNE